MAQDLEFRKVQKGDEQGLSQIFREVFNVDLDLTYWHWKYYQNPVGEHQMVVALDKNKIVGLFGSIPIRIKVGTHVLLASQGVDIVISPRYRKRGTFFTMEKITKELCFKNNIDLNYAFTIKETYRVFTKLYRFRGVCPIYNMSKVINPTLYLQQKLHLKSLAGVLGFTGKQVIKVLSKKRLSIPKELKIVEVTHFDNRFDDFWHKEAKNFKIAVIRDSHFLNWRYIDNPSPYKIFGVEQNGYIKGFIVLKCSQEEVKRGQIIDILFESGQEMILDLLLTTAIKYFFEQRVDVITCWMLEHWPAFKALKKKGFIKRETPHDFIIRSLTANLPNEYFMDKSKWYITMGDSDYF